MNDMNRLAYEVAAKDAIWPLLPVVMVDIDTGKIVNVSMSASIAFGYEAAELFGQPIGLLTNTVLTDVNTGWQQLIGHKKDGTMFPIHVFMNNILALTQLVGVIFITDLTGIKLHEMPTEDIVVEDNTEQAVIGK